MTVGEPRALARVGRRGRVSVMSKHSNSHKRSGGGSSQSGSEGNRGRHGPHPFEARASSRTDDANAFLPDPDGGPVHTDDDLAETLGEGFVEAATTGDDVDGEVLDRVVSEEIGGPFIVSDAATELASGTDEANPPDADVEPLPRAVAGLVENPPEDE